MESFRDNKRLVVCVKTISTCAHSHSKSSGKTNFQLLMTKVLELFTKNMIGGKVVVCMSVCDS